jgi:hypothetical protein
MPANAPIFVIVVTLCLSGCGSGETEYFPLEKGRSWQYRLTLDVIKETPAKKHLVRNLGVSEYDGEEVYVQQSQMGQLAYYQTSKAGIIRQSVSGRGELTAQEPSLLLPTPAEIGAEWQVQSRLRLIESRTFAREDRLQPRVLAVMLTYRVTDLDAEARTPAGYFRHCLEVSAEGSTQVFVDRHNNVASVSVKHQDWYAPGVGLVKSERVETSNSPFLEPGRYLLELERYQ